MRTRRAFRMEWLKNQAGEVVGLNLGADYCAEHEFGIKQLKTILGVQDQNPQGISSRKITQTPQENIYILDEVRKKKTGKTMLIVEGRYTIETINQSLKNLPSDFKPYAPRGQQPDLLTAWGEGGLCVVASKEEDKQNLRLIIQALKNQDLAMWLGGGGVFQNAGLVLAIISKVDETQKKTMADADEEALKLKLADEATGIKQQLSEARKGFYALSPAWSESIKRTKDGEIKTAYPVIYFLNPYEQNQYNSGWYTVEQLQAWTRGEGPIVKQKSA